MKNNQWYERFNTKVDAGTSIGFTRKHSVILEWTAQSTKSASYQDNTNYQKIEIQTDADERYLTYILLKQSAKTSEKLRTNLSNDYTNGENKYPTSCQETLHYLEKHNKSVVRAPTAKEGSLFAQRKGNGNPDTSEKNIRKIRITTSVGIKDTLHHIAKPNYTEMERRRKMMTTVFWCP